MFVIAVSFEIMPLDTTSIDIYNGFKPETTFKDKFKYDGE